MNKKNKPLEKLTKEEFNGLKKMGFLWEFYPNAPEFYKEIKKNENKRIKNWR